MIRRLGDAALRFLDFLVGALLGAAAAIVYQAWTRT